MADQLAEVRATLRHSGGKGDHLEIDIGDVLAHYLPRSLALSRGEVIDTHGTRSRQCDLVIVNDEHPFTFRDGGPGLFLIEGVAGVAEVKANLTTQHLALAIANVKAFRSLQPRWPPHSEFFGARPDLQRYLQSPPYFLFAFESQLSFDLIEERLRAAQGQGRRNESLDAVFVLSSGWMIDFTGGDGALALGDGSGERLKGYWWGDEHVLLHLLSWLSLSLLRPRLSVPILSSYILADWPSTPGDDNGLSSS